MQASAAVQALVVGNDAQQQASHQQQTVQSVLQVTLEYIAVAQNIYGSSQALRGHAEFVALQQEGCAALWALGLSTAVLTDNTSPNTLSHDSVEICPS